MAAEKTSTLNVEKQLGKVFTRLRDVQVKAAAYQKQAKSLAKLGELSARKSLHKVFDNGLTLLGKGLINGRKATESFVAETHRKAKRMENAEQTEELSNSPVSEVIPVEPTKRHASKASQVKSLNVKPTKKNKSKHAKHNPRHVSSARAH